MKPGMSRRIGCSITQHYPTITLGFGSARRITNPRSPLYNHLNYFAIRNNETMSTSASSCFEERGGSLDVTEHGSSSRKSRITDILDALEDVIKAQKMNSSEASFTPNKSMPTAPPRPAIQTIEEVNAKRLSRDITTLEVDGVDWVGQLLSLSFLFFILEQAY
jgi:hypothetical protein